MLNFNQNKRSISTESRKNMVQKYVSTILIDLILIILRQQTYAKHIHNLSQKNSDDTTPLSVVIKACPKQSFCDEIVYVCCRKIVIINPIEKVDICFYTRILLRFCWYARISPILNLTIFIVQLSQYGHFHASMGDSAKGLKS